MASKDYWKLEASTDGTVSQILFSPGDQVTTGDEILALEAMKMFFYETAPGDGFFYPLVPVGASVRQGQLIGKIFLEKRTA